LHSDFAGDSSTDNLWPNRAEDGPASAKETYRPTWRSRAELGACLQV